METIVDVGYERCPYCDERLDLGDVIMWTAARRVHTDCLPGRQETEVGE